MTPNANQENSVKWVIAPVLGAILFFGFLWLNDFPKPMIDDLFYSGAGLNMANGGDFSNPYITRYFPGRHYFFAYPPVYPYAIAGWLKIFGINSLSATGFQILMCCLVSVAVIAVLYRNGAPPFLAFLVPLIAAHDFADDGLRTEPMAVALSWVGFAMIECGARRTAAVFFALLLMFLSPATAPRNTFFDLALIVLAGWRLWQDAPDPRKKWRLIILAFAAGAAAIFVFSLMIHFKFADFWSEFHLHSQIIKINKGRHFGILQKVLIICAAGLAFFVWRFRSDRLVHICIGLGVAFGIAAFVGSLGYGPSGWHALLMILYLGAALLKRMPRPARITAELGLCGLFLWVNIPLLLLLYGNLSGNISTDRGDQYATARALTSAPDHQLMMDTSVARYTYDYKLPEGSIDFCFSAPFPRAGVVMPVLMTTGKPQDTYLLNPRYRAYVENSTYLRHEPRERWGWQNWMFDKYPCKVYIIRAEECKGLRSTNEMPLSD